MPWKLRGWRRVRILANARFSLAYPVRTSRLLYLLAANIKQERRACVMRWSLILCTALALADAAPPRCSWLCDDPSCDAICTPVCVTPACQCRVPATGALECDINPTCSTTCNSTYNAACPDCEVHCVPSPLCASCNTVCPPLSCGWDCVKPTSCPPPRCELQCEQPACSANVTHGSSVSASPGCAASIAPWRDSTVVATVITLSVLCALAVVLLCVTAFRGAAAQRPSENGTFGSATERRRRTLYAGSPVG